MEDDYRDARFNSYHSRNVFSDAPMAASGRARMLPGAPRPLMELATLYVARIPVDITENGLRNLFGRFGTVISASFSSSGSGELKHGKVSYSSLHEAVQAIKSLNNLPPLHLSVSHFVDREERNYSVWLMEDFSRWNTRNAEGTSNSNNSGQGNETRRSHFASAANEQRADKPREEAALPVRTVQRDFERPGPLLQPKQQSPAPATDGKKSSVRYSCISCGKNAKFTCTVCKKAFYCSENCQKSDWLRHKHYCGNNRRQQNDVQASEPVVTGNQPEVHNDHEGATAERDRAIHQRSKQPYSKKPFLKKPGSNNRVVTDNQRFKSGVDAQSSFTTKTKENSGGCREKTSVYKTATENHVEVPAHHPPPINDAVVIPKLNLTPGASVEVLVCHIQDPSCFYVNLLEEFGRLRELLNDLQESAKSTVVSDSIDNNQLVAACFSDDGVFYRAQVKKRNFDGSYVVFYIDFGNEEERNIEHLRPLSEKFRSLSSQAICCQLNDVFPSADEKWSPQSINFFRKCLYDKKLSLFCLDSSALRCSVNLTDETGTDIGKRLRDEGFARISMVDQVSRWRVGDVITLEYVEKHSAHEFWMTDVTDGDLLAPILELSSHSFSPIDRNLVSDGDYVVAQSKEYKLWYRAVVRKHLSDGSLYVHYLDYGNYEKVTNVAMFPEKLKHTPAFGVLVTTVDPVVASRLLESLEPDCINKFLAIVRSTGEETIIEIEQLAAAKMKAYSVCHPRFLEVDNCDVKTPDAIVQSEEPPLYTSRLLDPISEHEKVVKHFFTSTIEKVDCPVLLRELDLPFLYVSCSITELMNALESLQSKLASAYEANGVIPVLAKLPADGEFVCAKCPVKNTWLRSQVLKVVSSKQILVRFVDVGVTQSVPLDHMKPLKMDFASMPILAMRVLVHVDNIDVDDAILQDVLKPSEEVVWFMSVRDSSTPVPTVDLKKDEIRLKDLLTCANSKQALNVPDGESEPHCSEPEVVTSLHFKELELGKQLDVMVNDVTPKNKLYCCLVDETEMRNLDEFVAEITAYCEDTSSANEQQSFNPKKGVICLAKSLSYQQWFRAVVKNVGASDKYHVRFLDYGNIEEVPRDCLKPILPRFASYPVAAYKFTLREVKTDLNSLIANLSQVQVKERLDSGRYIVQL